MKNQVPLVGFLGERLFRWSSCHVWRYGAVPSSPIADGGGLDLARGTPVRAVAVAHHQIESLTHQTTGRLQRRGWVRFGLWNNWVGGSKSAGLVTSTRDATFDAE